METSLTWVLAGAVVAVAVGSVWLATPARRDAGATGVLAIGPVVKPAGLVPRSGASTDAHTAKSDPIDPVARARAVADELFPVQGGVLHVQQRLSARVPGLGHVRGDLDQWWVDGGSRHLAWRLALPCASSSSELGASELTPDESAPCSLQGQHTRVLVSSGPKPQVPGWLASIAELDDQSRRHVVAQMRQWQQSMYQSAANLDNPRRMVAGHECVEFELEYDIVCLWPQHLLPLTLRGPHFDLDTVAIESGAVLPQSVELALMAEPKVARPGRAQHQRDSELAAETIAARMLEFGDPMLAFGAIDPWLALRVR